MKLLNYIVFLFVAIQFSGCAYYNTMFNAENRYKEAVEKQKTVKSVNLAGDVKKNYNEAIKKCWSLIDTYGDSSKYADDALLLIGKCHFNLHEYPQSERVFEQFILKYNKSELVPDAKLWLAKSYVELERDDDALDLLNTLLAQEITSHIAGQAFFITGDLHYKRENYSDAVDNLTRSLDASSDEEILGDSHFLIGESYFQLEDFEKAAEHYDQVADLDVPILKEFDARMQQAEAHIRLENFSDAENIYKMMLRDIRFKKYFSTIETHLANLSEIQEEIDFARDSYYEVIKKYKNEEGVSLSAYYLAQLFEFHYSDMDSASLYYGKVRNLKLHEDIESEAKLRATLLKEYLKIRDQLNKDRKDIYSLARGDSTLEDSLVVEPDSTDLTGKFDLHTQKPETFAERNFQKSESDKQKQDSLETAPRPQAKKVNKVAVSRTPEQVHASHQKNSFNMAEFFLLKYQNYDSAAASYRQFIQTFPEDSILIPKSYYSLYYIYQELIPDPIKADSMKQVILGEYGQSNYGLKLGNNIYDFDENMGVDQQLSSGKMNYLKAERLLFDRQYTEAIDRFRAIAVSDSGTVWAQKSRYATAFIYETYLEDIPKAIETYRLIAEEYPGTEFAKIAKNKFKLPPKEVVPEAPEQTENIEEGESTEEVPNPEAPMDDSTIKELEESMGDPGLEAQEETPPESEIKRKIKNDLKK